MTSPFTDYLFNNSDQNESLTDNWQPEWEQTGPSTVQQPELLEEIDHFENVRSEQERESFYEFDVLTPSQDISDALNKKDWQQALKLAVTDCRYTEGELTNLLFFARHSELPKESLKPTLPNYDKLTREWKTIWINEVRPFIANEDLQVPVKYVFERDKEFAGDAGARFKKLVQDVATDVVLDPGFIAAVLLAETFRNSYLTSNRVSSFETGTDNFFASQALLRANVPAFSRVHFKRSGTNINEHGNEVISVLFNTGRDAALATGVYLKSAEVKLRNGAKKNGGDFDTFPVETQMALTRIAMAAGHGGIQPDGEFLWFKFKGGKTVPAKKGEPGSFLVGVAIELNRVLNGEDIFIRVNEDRKDPTNSRTVTLRNATILVAQALHISKCFFAAPPAAQPETESFEYLSDGYTGWDHTDEEIQPVVRTPSTKTTIFMTITGEKQGVIKGSITQRGKEGAMAVHQFQHQLLSPKDATTGAASGKRKHMPVQIVKAMDAASVKLLNSLITNERLKQVVIDFWRIMANGTEENFYRIQLTNASVAAFIQETTGSIEQSGLPVVERLELTYQKIDWSYLPGGLSAMDDLFTGEISSTEIGSQSEDESFEQKSKEEVLSEDLVPSATGSHMRNRLDTYLARCNFQYTLPDGTSINAIPQFRMTDGHGLKSESAKVKVKNRLARLGKACTVTNWMIHYATYGRARPSQVALITQCLINAGEYDTIKNRLSASASPSQIVRRLQFEFGIGIDCAGYVQNAFAFMALGKDNLSESERESLGLKKEIANERLDGLPAAHFQKVALTDALTGDIMVMAPRKYDDGTMHTVIVIEHSVDKGIHSFIVDSSWGNLYGDDFSGIARRTLVFESSTKAWWDIHPETQKAVNLANGPYNGHTLLGVYRARQLKPEGTNEKRSEVNHDEFFFHDSNQTEMLNEEVKDGAALVPQFEGDERAS